MTTFHLKADALDQSFLDKLRSLFAHKEIDIFVQESVAPKSSSHRADGISRLIAHPLGLKNFRMPSKDEIYSND